MALLHKELLKYFSCDHDPTRLNHSLVARATGINSRSLQYLGYGFTRPTAKTVIKLELFLASCRRLEAEDHSKEEVRTILSDPQVALCKLIVSSVDKDPIFSKL
jgi:hypothetical protein